MNGNPMLRASVLPDYPQRNRKLSVPDENRGLRCADYKSEGWEFESLRARHFLFVF